MKLLATDPDAARARPTSTGRSAGGSSVPAGATRTREAPLPDRSAPRTGSSTSDEARASSCGRLRRRLALAAGRRARGVRRPARSTRSWCSPIAPASRALAPARCEHGVRAADLRPAARALDARTLRGEVREAAEVIGLARTIVNERGRPIRAPARSRAERDKTGDRPQGQRDARHRDRDRAGRHRRATRTCSRATCARRCATRSRHGGSGDRRWTRCARGAPALEEERRKLDVALRAPAPERATSVDRQLATLGGAATRAYRTATVTVDCRALRAGDGDALVRRAAARPGSPSTTSTSSPRGAARSGPATRAPHRRARVIRQSTGEDWTDARLVAVDGAAQAGDRGAAARAAAGRRLRAGAGQGAGAGAGAARAARRRRRRGDDGGPARRRRSTTRGTPSC